MLPHVTALTFQHGWAGAERWTTRPYAVLRAVPRVDRGELMNAGVDRLLRLLVLPVGHRDR